MLDFVRQVLCLYLANVIQTTWILNIKILGIVPDVVIITIVGIALTSGGMRATALAFCAGFMQDTYLPSELGLNALSKSAIAFAIAEIRGRVVAEAPHVQILMICAAVLAHDFIFYIVHSGVGIIEVPYYWLRFGLGRAIYTSLASGLVVYTLQLLQRYFTK